MFLERVCHFYPPVRYVSSTVWKGVHIQLVYEILYWTWSWRKERRYMHSEGTVINFAFRQQVIPPFTRKWKFSGQRVMTYPCRLWSTNSVIIMQFGWPTPVQLLDVFFSYISEPQGEQQTSFSFMSPRRPCIIRLNFRYIITTPICPSLYQNNK